MEVTAAGHGCGWSGNRLVGTDLGGRLRHRSHRATRDGDWHTLTVHLHDPETGLVAEVTYRSPNGIPVLRSEVTLRNAGQTTLHLESVSSLAVGCLTPQDPAALDAADLLWAENDWLAECRWQLQPMRLTTPSLSGRVSYGHGRAGFALNGQGAWSSCGHLPMGGLTDRRTGRTWVWQIEHNGGDWRWECEERDKAAYAALFGPTDTHHGWRHSLEPGAVFRTVPAALSFSADGGPDAAFAALTRYRRAQRRPHADHQRLPVIFNDYMNCLMGDPTTEKLLPLIDAAADTGAEYFVIDAGWYDGDNGGWWDSVGAWEPAASRFPGSRGIHEVLDRIRERGMVPGLWLEPEVIGVRSPMAKSLPDEAFFRRDGVRVTEAGRHHLDLRHPAAPAHLDQVVDRLVGEWGVGYLKLDHNIDPGSGTSAHPGLLHGQRAPRPVPQAVPSWPLGLPAWDHPWVALALRTPATTYLTAWRRPGNDTTATLQLPHLRDTAARADLLYRSSGLSRSESAQPHAPNGLGRTGPRRTQPRGGDTHPVRGPGPGGRFPKPGSQPSHDRVKPPRARSPASS